MLWCALSLLKLWFYVNWWFVAVPNGFMRVKDLRSFSVLILGFWRLCLVQQTYMFYLYIFYDIAMDIKPSRSVGDKNERGRRHVNNMVCSFWLRGRCNKNPCRFLYKTCPKIPTIKFQISFIKIAGRGILTLIQRVHQV